MALFTGFAVAGVVEPTGAILPPLAMRVETDDPPFGAMAGDADVSARMAGLTGMQVFSGFTCVPNRPIMEAGSYRPLQVACIAIRVRAHAGMNGIDVAV